MHWADLVTRAIEQGKALEASWATAQMIHAAWRAELTDANVMIEKGVKLHRGKERHDTRKSSVATRRHREWQEAADRIWATRPNATKSNVASMLAMKFEVSAGRIRNVIAAPKK
jgi:hypothetical protein